MSRVLIIESDPMVGKILEGYMKKIGTAKIYGPVDEYEAITAIIEEEKIELILLAVYLKGENGLSILKKLRHAGYEEEVIMVTAAHTVSEIKKAYAYGAMDYLIKPVSYERFRAAFLKHQKRNYYLHNRGKLKQEELDEMMRYCIHDMELPKGLNRHTLERIITFLKENGDKVWTLRELAWAMNLSNVTIKKYMDHLEQQELVDVKMTSGQIGRPEHQYYLVSSE